MAHEAPRQWESPTTHWLPACESIRAFVRGSCRGVAGVKATWHSLCAGSGRRCAPRAWGCGRWRSRPGNRPLRTGAESLRRLERTKRKAGPLPIMVLCISKHLPPLKRHRDAQTSSSDFKTFRILYILSTYCLALILRDFPDGLC